jgi:hypothetical protein
MDFLVWAIAIAIFCILLSYGKIGILIILVLALFMCAAAKS